MQEASYVSLYRLGQLNVRVIEAQDILQSCTLCPRRCGINRLEGERGYCRSGVLPSVSSYGPHFGEEPPLVGTRGSGTIFMTNCTMHCLYCQNYDISYQGMGREVRVERLADMMLDLQNRGCHNVNFVTPTHYIPQILAATEIAAVKGLHIPLVYNTSGYDRPETLKLLEGVFDIYMPDAKYCDEGIARSLSDTPDYVEAMKSSILEMHRQVGDLVVEKGVAVRGLIIRHLVLPDRLAGTEEIMEFIARQISVQSYVNVMAQYHPCGEIVHESNESRYHAMTRRTTPEEYREAVDIARSKGLWRGIYT